MGTLHLQHAQVSQCLAAQKGLVVVRSDGQGTIEKQLSFDRIMTEGSELPFTKEQINHNLG